jgi:hypothetical protein
VSDARVGTKKRAFGSNKETDEGKICTTLPKLLDKPHTRKPRWGNERLGGRRYGDLIAAGDELERVRDDPGCWATAKRLLNERLRASQGAGSCAI